MDTQCALPDPVGLVYSGVSPTAHGHPYITCALQREGQGMFPLRPAKLAAITLISVCFTLSTSVTSSTTQPRAQTDWVAESTISDIAAIHDVTFADDSNGWAVGGSSSGSGAAVFVTQDGGLTWKTQITPATDP